MSSESHARTCWTSCVSTSPPEFSALDLPTFFLDRSVGRLVVPAGLRAIGLTVITLAEHYGMPADETISDSEWLTEAGRNGWVGIKSDANIRRKDAPERRALVQARVRTFVLSGQLTAAHKVQRLITNMPAIARACRRPGPFVYRIHPDRIQRLQIPGT